MDLIELIEKQDEYYPNKTDWLGKLFESYRLFAEKGVLKDLNNILRGKKV